MSSSPAGSRAKSLAKTFAPWLVAAFAMLWVFRSVNFHDLKAAFAHAPVGRFLAASVALLVLNCAADCLAMLFTFRWFGCEVPYRELFVVRAATYLLAVVQYYVGQAAIIGYLHARKGVPGWRAAGFILFISGINMGVLVILASAGLATGDTPVRWLRFVPFAVGGGAACYALLLLWKPPFLARWSMMAPLFEMGVVGHLKATAVRIPHVMVIIVWHFLALRWFGVEVPAVVALVYLPAVFFAAALPVSVQGLGLSQAAAVYFFASYSTGGEAAVLAYSLAMTGVALVVQVTMGLLFLPAGRRLGMKAPVDATEPERLPGVAALRVEASDG